MKLLLSMAAALGLFTQLPCAFAASAADPPDFVVTTWRIQDGLPSDRVRAVLQTRDGYLWVATFNGLGRFDGVQFRRFNDANTPVLRNSLINSLFEDSSERLWIGSDTGEISWRDSGGFHALKTPENWRSSPIDRFAQAGDGLVYAANRDGFLLCISNCQSLAVLGQLPINLYSDVTSDSSGRAWAIRYRGIMERLSGLSTQTNDVPPPQYGYRDAIGARHGGLWVRNGPRLRRWNDGKWVEDRGTHSWKTKRKVVLFETELDDVWVGTVDEGIFIVAPDGSERHIDRSTGLGHDFVSSITSDYEGNIWVGTDGGGLEMLRRRVLSMISPPDHWQNRTVLSVAPAADGGLWIGTEGAGLYRWSNGEFSRVSSPPLLAASDIRTVLQDHSGRLWAGTQGAGLLTGSEKGLASLKPAGEIRNRPLIYALFEDNKKTLWAGTQDGLLRLAGTNWSALGQDLFRAEVRCIDQTPDGTLWIGMRGGGVARYWKGQFEQYRHGRGLPYDYVWCLHADQEGTVWIGTPGAGLIRFRDGVFSSFTERDGLPSDFICSIQADDAGHLWIGSYGGIFELDTAQLQERVRGGTNTLSMVVLDRNDGLESLEIAGGNQPSACRTADGRLWFATSTGLAALDPGRIKPHRRTPPVRMEEVLIDGMPVSFDASGNALAPATVTAPPGSGSIEFRYTALSFSAPQRCRFRYRLEKSDAGWIDAGTRRFAHYSHLPPREYRFDVMGCNGDGVWNTTGASVAVNVLPHVWENWWFAPLCWIAGISLAGSAALVAVRRRHQRRIEALERAGLIERERGRIARDLHDELGSALTEISMTSAMARAHGTPADEARQCFDDIVNRSTEMVSALDEIVWAVNPKNDDLNSFVTYICQFTERFLGPASIACRFRIPAPVPAVVLNSEQRHNLFMAVKEALQNVVKHSGAASATLGVSIGEHSLRISIEDDGRGFVEGEPAPGADGLRNMRERLGQIQGRCEISGGPGQGTRVTFVMPIAPPRLG